MTNQGYKAVRYYSACLFFASLNYEMLTVFSNFSVAKLAGLVYVLISLLSIKTCFKINKIGDVLLALGLMFFTMVFSSVVNGNKKCFDSTLVFNIVTFWILLNHARNEPRLYKNGLIWFSISAALLGMLFIMDQGVTISDSGRIEMFGDNENSVGIKMAMAILFIFDYCLSGRNGKMLHKPILLLLIIPSFLLLVGTASRTALVVLVSGFIVFFLLRPSKKMIYKFLGIIIGVAALIWGARFLQTQEIIYGRVMRTVEEGSMSQRDLIWALYYPLWKENWFIGVGFSGAESYALAVFGQTRSPHNVFLEVALYSGVIGVVFLAYFVFQMIKAGIKQYKLYGFIYPVLLLVGISAILLTGQALNVKFFWVFASAILAMRVMNSNAFVTQRRISI